MSNDLKNDWRDSGNNAIIIDVYKSPLPILTFEDVLVYRLHELTTSDEKQSAKLPVRADGKLRQGIAIITDYNLKHIRKGCRFFMFLYGALIVNYLYGHSIEEIDNLYLRVVRSENDEIANEATNPGGFTLTQHPDSRKYPPIQLYLYQRDHDKMESVCGRLGIDMSDYAVVCFWSSILASEEKIPDRLREHGLNLVGEFKTRIEKRLKDMRRLSSEVV